MGGCCSRQQEVPQVTPRLYCITEDGDEIIEYDVSSNTTAVHCLPHAVPSQARYCLLPTQRLLITGGCSRKGAPLRTALSSVYVFDPREGAMLRAKSCMQKCRFGQGLVVHECHVFAISGSEDGVKAMTSCERYSYQGDQWSESPSLEIGRIYAGTCALKNKLYVTGGSSGSECIRVIEVYDVPLGAWAQLELRLPVSVWCHGCVAFETGVLVFGGCACDGQSCLGCFLVSVTAKRITQLPGLPHEGEFVATVQSWRDSVYALESYTNTTLCRFAEGQCGVRVAAKFWPYVSAEYGIDSDQHWSGKYSPHPYFHEQADGRFEPRAVLMDTDPTSLDWVGASTALFRSECLVAGQGSCGNLWAKGMYTDGCAVGDVAWDQVRKEVEKCEYLVGFQLTSSLGGGAGAGLTCRMLQRLRDEHCSRIVQACAVFPHPEHSDSVLETYNAVLCFPELTQHADQVVVLDNHALERVCRRYLPVEPRFPHLNALIATALSAVTASHRYPSQPGCSFRKLQMHLSPFCQPRLHFLSCAPVGPAPENVCELVEQVLDPRNVLCSLDPRGGHYQGALCVSRGAVSPQDLDAEMRLRQDHWSPYFLPYLQERIHSVACAVPALNSPLSGCLLGNSSAMTQILTPLQERFGCMFRRNAYVGHYEQCGMDKMEFVEAASHLADLIEDYERREV